MRRVQRDMHMRDVTIAYGMTETSPASYQSTCETPLEKRVSTIGKVHPHLEAKVVHPESGDTVPTGVVGELCIRGYSLMQGYWNDPERPFKPSTATAGSTAATWPRWMPRATSASRGVSRIW